ncbi:threonine-phosphate decarboxylase CobD [soil metagenome]
MTDEPMSAATSLPAPGPHGGDGPHVAKALALAPGELLDLSQNMNPFAPDVGVIAGRHMSALAHYPDSAQAQVALAGVLGVAADRVIVTNGGSEAIHLVAVARGGHPRSEPEFALHPRKPLGPIWRSNPHSPSGKLATDTERADVWDEAFYPLTTGAWTAGRPGLVVGSLTKTFTCPGLRLGYVLLDAASDPAEFLARLPRWSANSLALACLPQLLEQADLRLWADQLTAAKADLVSVLRGHHLRVEAAEAPWVLVKGGDLRTRLAPYAVLVRDCASFGMSDTYRIAVPDAAGLRRLRIALERAGIDGSTEGA